MGKLGDFITGTKVLEEIESPINRKIKIVKSLGYGTHVQIGGLTQSGGIVETVWSSTLKKVKSLNLPAGKSGPKAKNCLILGLGAGSAAKLVRKYWPKVKITGVEIDPIMIEMGRKYFGLDKLGINVKIQDASKAISEKLKAKSYDLILIDMYVGDEIPKRFESEKFIKDIKKLLRKNGFAIFNRLYYGDKRKIASKFGQLLENNFSQVIYHYPEANLMFLCLKK